MMKYLSISLALIISSFLHSQSSFDSIIKKTKEINTWEKLLVENPNYNDILSQEIVQLQELVEESLIIRDGMTRMADKIKSNKKGQLPHMISLI